MLSFFSFAMKPEKETVNGYEIAKEAFTDTESKSLEILKPKTLSGLKTPID